MTDGPVRWIATPRCHPQLSHSRILAIRARHSTCVPAGHRPQRPGLLGGTTARHRILADSFRPKLIRSRRRRLSRAAFAANSQFRCAQGSLSVRRRRSWRSSLADLYRNRDTTRDDARCVLEGDRQGDVNTDIFLGRSFGLNNRLIMRTPVFDAARTMRRRSRLGRLLNYYERAA